MKYLLLIILCCLSVSADAQVESDPKPIFPSPFEFKLIDTAKGTKTELYVRARSWFAKMYNSSKAVLQMEDKEAGKLIGKAIISYRITAILGGESCESPINYTITIDVKDGKYRCTLSNFYHEGCITNSTLRIGGGNLDDELSDGSAWHGGPTQKQWEKIKSKAMDQAEMILLTLKYAMMEDYSNAKKDDGY